ncbi:MAG: LytS/YhcK type 5TM receptor domain-containing protein, partial [Kiritimatiellales bacterium]
MKNEILIPLLNNAVLLLALATVYDLLTAREGRTRKKAVRTQIATGCLLGVLGIGLMLASVRFAPGVIFDTRSVLLSVSGLFFGLIPTVIAMVMTALFRFFIGGSAIYTGVCVIVATGSLGLFWRKQRPHALEEISAGELYLFGIINHVFMLALMLLLPLQTALTVLAGISIPRSEERR